MNLVDRGPVAARVPCIHRFIAATKACARSRFTALTALARMPVYWGRCPAGHTGTALVILPYSPLTLRCGLAGLISIRRNVPPPAPAAHAPASLENLFEQVQSCPLDDCLRRRLPLAREYLGGDGPLGRLYTQACTLKQEDRFLVLFGDPAAQRRIAALSERLNAFVSRESGNLQQQIGYLPAGEAEIADLRIEKLKDAAWCLESEILANIEQVKRLLAAAGADPSPNAVKIFRNINTVLNSIDRLEVRGRDSAGISLLFLIAPETYTELKAALIEEGLSETLSQRTERSVLGNRSIRIHRPDGGLVGIGITYKVAAEIGSLGDNGRQLRRDIAQDSFLHLLARHPHRFHTVSAHTRWASVGAITIANCHPVDNATAEHGCDTKGVIHACLNGDIDNYLELKRQWEASGDRISEEISTDTKIIPLRIEHYLRLGHGVEEAFRRAVCDFDGSHAIAMHTNLAPGKFFLAQKGSGQALFVGLAEDYYLPTSEVYGFVEQTDSFIKMHGERVIDGPDGPVQGQIFILDQDSAGGLDGIRAMYYDGTPVDLSEQDVQHTQITSRDIDRQNFPHYFLKEISESPVSVAKTLQNRWKIDPADPERYTIALPDNAFPESIVQALSSDRIRRIYFIGQGTAGIAAQVISDILDYYLMEPSMKIRAMKSSELSGFQIENNDTRDGMADTLVIAISQSGTTTDTNRAVDMVRARGALTLAIVNRRDSDLTFKVDGVVYTSSGRDIEMSVASTKAFYSQIVAGALISLTIAAARQRRPPAFVAGELKALLALPDQMRRVLALQDAIQASAERLAPIRTYWAAVGSGPNKSAADEIRIKLSELCYKTISSDFVEDKKHIDLSSEPLIIVCAAGAGNTVLGDIIKDTAIFRAHKAAPVVIVDEGESRFDAYAEDIFQVPAVTPHLAPILNTLVGHLWGYYAALAINGGSRFLHDFREDIRQTIDRYAQDGLDIYEALLEQSFREKIARFYTEFRLRLNNGRLPSTIRHAADLLLLLKYLAGRLPVSDFQLDFGKKGTAMNMVDSLFQFLGESINGMSRPVDAIKHQAKTVTVGTSRISEKIEGILFDALGEYQIGVGQLIHRNVLVLKNLQHVVSEIKGAILYRIDGLDLLGEPTDRTTITIVRKEGVLKPLASRVETDNHLKGTKRIVVRQGNIYIGKGRKDDRSILLIPAISTDPSAPNRIEQLLLLHIGFRDNVALPLKIKALGGKFEHIKNIVQENSIAWDDRMLEMVPMEILFGRSAEKVGEAIVASVRKTG